MAPCESIIIDGEEFVKKVPQEIAEDNYCIVRTYSAGVFAGNLVERNGKEGKIENARRIWYWSGAASLSQLAMEGTKDPSNCKFPCPVKVIELTEIIEVIPCTKAAEKSIKGTPVWQK
jgi:hypothetical protein